MHNNVAKHLWRHLYHDDFCYIWVIIAALFRAIWPRTSGFLPNPFSSDIRHTILLDFCTKSKNGLDTLKWVKWNHPVSVCKSPIQPFDEIVQYLTSTYSVKKCIVFEGQGHRGQAKLRKKHFFVIILKAFIFEI